MEVSKFCATISTRVPKTIEMLEEVYQHIIDRYAFSEEQKRDYLD